MQECYGNMVRLSGSSIGVVQAQNSRSSHNKNQVAVIYNLLGMLGLEDSSLYGSDIWYVFDKLNTFTLDTPVYVNDYLLHQGTTTRLRGFVLPEDMWGRRRTNTVASELLNRKIKGIVLIGDGRWNPKEALKISEDKERENRENEELERRAEIHKNALLAKGRENITDKDLRMFKAKLMDTWDEVKLPWNRANPYMDKMECEKIITAIKKGQVRINA